VRRRVELTPGAPLLAAFYHKEAAKKKLNHKKMLRKSADRVRGTTLQKAGNETDKKDMIE
jgi:hypothetical protein